MYLINISWKDINNKRKFAYPVVMIFMEKKESKNYKEIFEYLNEKYAEIEKKS